MVAVIVMADVVTRAHQSAANRVEAVVIGAGVIGLAVARALALKGKEVLIVERASTIGSGTFMLLCFFCFLVVVTMYWSACTI